MKALWRSDFKKPKQTRNNSFEIGYDLDFDKDLISQSIAKQYHILPSQQGNLKYSDWVELLSGLMEDTPLGRTVQLRLERDEDALKNLSPQQKKIREDWQNFLSSHNGEMSRAEYDHEMRKLEQMISKMFGDDKA